MHVLINLFLNTVAVMVGAYLLPGVDVAGFWTALVAAVVIGIINAVLKPILIILTLPINILTLGLLTFVINAMLILLASVLVSGFDVANFWSALLFSLLLSLFSLVFNTHRAEYRSGYRK
ncbi:MAG TPA: phage holin family protein [Patescibacteria group bacterium]|nr:phage holin family protein [Patescibacteria group bacterium]